jgi:methylated-DNA-protein-cysteine methyltransferase-like protein
LVGRRKENKILAHSNLTMAEPNFFQDVLEVTRLIPEGRVTSYGAIAKYLGSAKSARMVGWAMNSSFSTIPSVPAHRVVNRLGVLSGRMSFETPTKMQELLEKEGVKVMRDRIEKFDELFWDPIVELGLTD